LRKKIETERDAVAVLRAEWSLLNRPERIERLAKKHLKLNGARPQQLVTVETVSDSDFERIRMEATEDSLPASSAPPNKVKSVPMPGIATAPAAPANFDDDLPAPTKTVSVKTVPIKGAPSALPAFPPPVTVSPPEE
jgi:hypothetical protein